MFFNHTEDVGHLGGVFTRFASYGTYAMHLVAVHCSVGDP
jgi:hypothetical protein